MMTGRRFRRMLILGPVAAAAVLGVFAWSYLRLLDEARDLRETGLRFETTSQDLLANIGFVGLIHDFKNCVLRPDEPEYCAQAEAHARRAEELIAELDRLAAEIGLDERLDGLLETVRGYGARAAVVETAHAEGRPILEIDDAVRLSDSAAAAEIETTLRQARRTLKARLDRLRDLYLVQAVAGMLSMVALAGWFAFMLLREHRLSLAQEERLSAVFGALSGGVIGFDAAGRVAMINRQGRAMLGAETATPPFDWPEQATLRAPEDNQPATAHGPFGRLVAGDGIKGETYLLSLPGGEEHYVRITGGPLRSGGDIAAVAVLDDVTQQERHRQHIERNSRLDALGQLSGGIAHDFNNLLATILYAVNLALNEEQSERSQRLLKQAIASVDRGRNLTGRLLSFAKRQPGTARSRTVAEVLREFEALARPAIEASIAMHVEPPDPALYVHCDQSQLENALLNLVLNSRDAILGAGQGSEIRVSARAVTSTSSDLRRRQRAEAAEGRPVSAEDYRYVELSVIDDGPGMSAEVRRRATDPFFSTKDQGQGTGLGLAMVYGFARQSNGEMQIYSDEGHGTTVRLTLPRGTPENRREGPVSRPEVVRGEGETVLLVEDEPDLLSIMSEMLTDLGYVVETATSGTEALSRIRGGLEFDLLLSDMIMPGEIDGLTLARRLRRVRRDARVVLMSGYAERMASETQGIEYPVLQKPCMPEELAAAIRTALKG